ncbi:MAG TPA: L-threonylcarbamoyladenylate synthase [Saprospiraceae bacterium]|nr:L-threonylcarbamoyladenylate synthase [Saprospiraceae bacterium]
MLIKIHPETPSERRVKQIVDILNVGGVIIYPTDTVYALACAMDQKAAFEKICRIKKVTPAKAKFSMIFEDLSQVAKYTAQTTTPQYRLLKKHLPGPFTFILGASSELPSHLKAVRKTIGIRIPHHNVSLAIVKALGKPLFTSSLRSDDEILEYYNDPEEIHDEFGKLVDVVIDAGPGTFEPSTVVDLTKAEPEILREGKGVL